MCFLLSRRLSLPRCASHYTGVPLTTSLHYTGVPLTTSLHYAGVPLIAHSVSCLLRQVLSSDNEAAVGAHSAATRTGFSSLDGLFSYYRQGGAQLGCAAGHISLICCLSLLSSLRLVPHTQICGRISVLA